MAGYPEGVEVRIILKAFGEFPDDNLFVTTILVDWLEGVGLSDDEVLDAVFHATNTYSGSLWNLIEPRLSERRTHTALSVGDEVEVDGRTYRCDPVGWSAVPSAHTFTS
jgi:hypothetical protein